MEFFSFLSLLAPIGAIGLMITLCIRSSKVEQALAEHRDTILALGAAGTDPQEIARRITDEAGMKILADEVTSAVKKWRQQALKAEKFRNHCAYVRSDRSSSASVPANGKIEAV